MDTNLENTNCELINISGVGDANDITNVISQYPYWIQMNIPETLTIPEEKPDMEQINSINISVNIFRSEVIKVPKSPVDINGNYIPNLEGKISTGRKIIIQGELCQKVVYTANEAEQSVHSAHFYVPFSSYIIVPSEILFNNELTATDSLYVSFQVNSCIENVTARMLDPRTILKQVTLLLFAVPEKSL